MNKIIITLIFISLSLNNYSQIIKVNDAADAESSYTPQELIDNVLISGSCAITDNFTTQLSGSPTDFTTKSYGYFKRPSGSSFPFEEGIVISSGYAHDAGNSTITSTLEKDNGLFDDDDSIDGDLNDIFPGVVYTNASVIEFDFVPFTDTLSFRFLLASEEYEGVYPCIYSDGFAFLLKDTVTNSINNIALVPDSGDPVSTQNIHPEILNNDGSVACSSDNEDFFEGYSIPDTNFNGRTKVMSVSASVIPNRTYRIKLVVADAAYASSVDPTYDSAIFLEGGSFNLGDGLAALAENIPKLADCDNGSVGNNFDGFNLFDLETNKTIILNGQSNTDYTLTYFEDDQYTVQIPATDVTTYANITELQTIYVQMTNALDATCFDRTSFEIEVYKLPEINYSVDFLQCDGDVDPDGISIMDINTVNSYVSSNYENETFTFYKIKADAENENSASLITNPENYENIASPFNETVFVRVENDHCHVVGQINIKVSVTNTVFNNIIEDCDDFIEGISDEYDGTSEFDLTQFTDDILSGIPISDKSNLRIKFYGSFEDAQLQNNVISQPHKYRNVKTDTSLIDPERIFIRVENLNNLDCAGLNMDLYIDLVVKKVPKFEIENIDDLLYCTNSNGEKTPIRIDPSSYPADYDYVWKDSNDNVLETDLIDDELAYFTHAGDYTVTAVNSDPAAESDCIKTILFTVKESSLPIIKEVKIIDNILNNQIIVTVEGIGDYEFALDNDDFNDANINTGFIYNNVIEGLHTIRIQDKFGCNPVIERQVVVIRFPKHISPDHNGKYDEFYIYGGDGYVLSSLTIFDRYGKVVVVLKNNEKWDGTYLGKIAKDDDYWFSATFVDTEGNIYKRRGNFSLVTP